MHLKSLLALSAIAVALSGVVPAHSQGMMAPAVNREAELIGLRQLCETGNRQACIKFGFMLGESRERHVEWRRSHPDWWAWEH